MDEKIKLTIREAIEHLENQKACLVSFEENRVAIDMAIAEMKKAIPAKPIDNGNWSAKTCPTCGEELSEHMGDGYYQDSVCLISCPNCRQLLDWN